MGNLQAKLMQKRKGIADDSDEDDSDDEDPVMKMIHGRLEELEQEKQLIEDEDW
jgi:hypothetical protein